MTVLFNEDGTYLAVLSTDDEIEQERLDALREIANDEAKARKENPELFEDDDNEKDKEDLTPGGFTFHEALDRCGCIADNICRQLMAHDIILNDPEYFRMAKHAFENIFNLHNVLANDRDNNKT